jgi:hypothetical protein
MLAIGAIESAMKKGGRWVVLRRKLLEEFGL